MTLNIKIRRIILGVIFIASSCYPILLYIHYRSFLKITDLILLMIVSLFSIILGILVIKHIKRPFVFNRQKKIFLVAFILFAIIWLFYIQYEQTQQVKKIYDIEISKN